MRGGRIKNIYPKKCAQRFQKQNYSVSISLFSDFGVITYGMLDTVEKSCNEWSIVADNIMFALIHHGEAFTADAFYEMAVKELMPPSLIKKFAGSKIREFQAANYLRKSKNYTISKRNGGATLPFWEPVNLVNKHPQ